MDPSGNSVRIIFWYNPLTFEPEASASLNTFVFARAAFYQVELQAHLYDYERE